MELKFYLAILGRRWRIFVLVALLIGIASVWGSKFMAPNYQSDALLQVITPLSGSVGNTQHETSYANRLINTYGQIASSDQVMNELKTKLAVRSLPAISVKIIPESEIIQITVNGSDPDLVAKTANGLAELIIAKQNEAVNNNVDFEDLNILANRRDELAKELEAANQELDRLIQVSSQAASELALLDRTMRATEGSYENLLLRYQQFLIDRGAVPTVINQEIDRLEKELGPLDQQYKDLSAKSNEYSQQIAILKQTIQNDETAYSDALARYESAQSASLRQQRTQDILLVSPAFKPTNPTGPGRIFVLGLGLIFGCIAGIIVAFVYETMDTRIFNTEQLVHITPTPVLGDFPKIRNHTNLTVPRLNESVIGNKNYWMLCSRLAAQIHDKSIKTILVTSPSPMEGKSILTAALASGLTRSDYKVLVVDADLRRPHQHKLYQLSGEQGLDTFLRDEKSKVEEIIQKNVKLGIDVLPSLTSYNDPTDLLQPSRLAALLENIGSYDVVLFDTPALLAAPDAYALAKIMDGVIIVVEQGKTTSENLRLVCNQLEAVGSKLMGIIMNQVPMKSTPDYYSGKIGWNERFFSLREKFSINALMHTFRTKTILRKQTKV